MKVNVDGKDYSITFMYDEDKICTKAFIRWMDTDGSLREEEGLALLSDKDTFDPIIGRKVALQRAMKYADFDKPLRAKIWAALVSKGFRLTKRKSMIDEFVEEFTKLTPWQKELLYKARKEGKPLIREQSLCQNQKD